jgi:hypothetical protein
VREKYQLAKWNVVCHPKDQGGLGIHDLEQKPSIPWEMVIQVSD